jgi:hypothetical protein
VFSAQADWIFILPPELPTKLLRHLPRKIPPQAYETSQYVAPRGGIFLGKWRSIFAGGSDGKMNVQSACALNILYIPIIILPNVKNIPVERKMRLFWYNNEWCIFFKMV